MKDHQIVRGSIDPIFWAFTNLTREGGCKYHHQAHTKLWAFILQHTDISIGSHLTTQRMGRFQCAQRKANVIPESPQNGVKHSFKVDKRIDAFI